MATYREARRGEALVVHAYTKANLRPEWHNCEVPPYYSLKQLPDVLDDGLVWTARDGSTLVGVAQYARDPDDTLQLFAGFCDSGREAEIFQGFFNAVRNRGGKIRVPFLPPALEQICEERGLGFRRRTRGGFEA